MTADHDSSTTPLKILIIANHYAVCSARYAAGAFTRLGHDVRHIGRAMGRSIWGMEIPQEYVWEPDKGLDAYPDMIIVMDSDPYVLDGKQLFTTGNGKPLVVWGVDNHVREYRRPWFDHYFLAHRNVSMMKWDATYAEGVGMTHLPCAYDPHWFTPSPIPWNEREYDVCMIGVMYPQRWQLVNALRAAGLKVLAGTGLIYDAYRDAYHNSRISLCQSINGDVAQRVFETAMLGCVVMSDDCPDYQILHPQGLWLIDKGVSIVEQAQSVLADPVSAQAQIARSQTWAAPHTWDARAQTIVDSYTRTHGEWHKSRI